MSPGDFDADLEQCRRSAIAEGALAPRGFLENIAANHMSANNQSWSDTELARHRLMEAIRECMRLKGYNV